ncbi:MAG: hypothetical protein ACXVPQ_07100 [Bacteroidia bacterium]
MKQLSLTIIALCLLWHTSAHAQSFKFGTVTADAGVGFGLYGIHAYSPINHTEQSGLGFVGTIPSVDAEFGLLRLLGVGVHYRRGGYGAYEGGKIRGNDLCLMADLHLANKRDKFDLIIGAGYGLSTMKTPSTSTDQLSAKGGIFRIQVEPKLYFGKYVGMFFRIAYNKHFLNRSINIIDKAGRVYTEADGATWNMGGIEFNIGIAAKFDLFKKQE